MLEALWQDIRYAARSLIRTPSFTAAALLTLALGIGANTAIFSVVNAVVLRPLPYNEPDRIVGVWNSWADTPRGQLSPAEYFDYADRVDAFEHLGVYRNDFVTLTASSEPTRLRVGIMSNGVLPALGVAPSAGRTFSAADDLPGSNVVLLSDGLWRQRFGGSTDIVGQRIVLDGRSRTVIGILPPGFRLPRDFDSPEPAQLFLPLGLDRGTIPNRGFHFLSAVARLKPGFSFEQAATIIGAVAAQFPRDFPGDYPKSMRFAATVTPLHDDVVGEVRLTLLMLMGAIGFVLLIACANITNLFLSRSERRQEEFIVRTALGATRSHLVRQALVESGLVAIAGGSLGVLLAKVGTIALVTLRPPNLPRMDSIGVDITVLAFAAAVSVMVGLLVGLVPALRTASENARGVLQESARAIVGKPQHHRVRHTLVASEIAFAIVLLMGAGLLARSFQGLLSVKPGYRIEQLLTASITVPVAQYRELGRASGFFVDLLDRLRQQQDVDAAGAVAGLPLTSERGDMGIQVEGRESPAGTSLRRADWQVVTPGYFDAMGIRIVRGRGIEPTDREDSPGVVVVNEAAARLHWPNADPVGTRLKLGRNAKTWLTVVGVANDVRQESLRAEAQPEMYLPHTQFNFFGGPVRDLTVVLRSSKDPSALADTLRREVAAVDPNVPVAAVHTMREVRSESVSTLRFVMLLLSTFAGVALAVAMIGVYGVVAYSAAQRKREIGVRVSLGANPGRVIALILRQGLLPAGVGIALGLAGGIALSRVLEAQLYQVSPNDPATAAVVSSLVALVAFVACYVPARRAATVNPIDALRAE